MKSARDNFFHTEDDGLLVGLRQGEYWQLNHVRQIYGAMYQVFAFVETFKEFPPRSFPPSFVPTTIMEQTLEQIKQQRARAAQPAK